MFNFLLVLEAKIRLIVSISFLQTYGALFCETSAKDGSNIVEAVLHLAR